jgi:hypothetical protein
VWTGNIDFRDEYIRLADDTASAEKLLDNWRIFQKEITAGKIRSNNFLRSAK